MPAAIRPIRVAIVEDDMDFFNALRATVAVAGDMVLAHSAATCKEGLLMLERDAADVLVVDLGLPDGSGIDIIRAAGLKWPACAVLVSSAFGDEAHVMGTIEAGAAGYLLKHAEPACLADQIRSVFQGGSPISPLIARQILTRFRLVMPPEAAGAIAQDGATTARPELSPREREVLELLTKGFTAEEIAALIEVSSHTVLTFIRRIYRKLKVNSRAQAIYEARLQGLLT